MKANIQNRKLRLIMQRYLVDHDGNRCEAQIYTVLVEVPVDLNRFSEDFQIIGGEWLGLVGGDE